MKCPFCGSDDTQVVDTRASLERVAHEVKALCARFPVYT